MATARKLVFLPDRIGWYHCISRCVRRGFWQGQSTVTGEDFRHRKDWIEARLGQLSQVFAIDQAAYSVMENHVHVVVRVDPERAQAWSDEEVARRWLSIFPTCWGDAQLRVPSAETIAEWLKIPEKVRTSRARLGDLSWFMGRLNEWVARRANREENCTGRFWEGRFKCQRIADAGGVLATMMYVDLNPVRAGVVSVPEESPHTSIRRRVELARAKADPSPSAPGSWLLPIEQIFPDDRPDRSLLTFHKYLELADALGRTNGRKTGPRQRRAKIPADLHPILERLGLSAKHLPDLIGEVIRMFHHVIGSPGSLRKASEESGHAWLTRSAAASLLYRPAF